MSFVVMATKTPGADSIREATRSEHLKFMIEHRDRVRWGGSFEDDHGAWGGMTLVVDADSLDDVQSWIDSEPYCTAGLFESVSIAPFRQLIPEPFEGLLRAVLRSEEIKRAASKPEGA
ncbi:YciI family protein [Rhodococcoides fascians]|uniref:YciI family protein n=1 Tax=Rhodococcoides fascians TaxID=1828 RepID=UPI0012D2CF3E|nr:YciI family protein [Rhodococcus fascians]